MKINNSVITTVDLGDGIKVNVNISQKGINLVHNNKKIKKILSVVSDWERIKKKFQEDWDVNEEESK